MKKAEIVKGKKYTDEKGCIRLVLDIGNKYKLYDSQESTDTLQYKLIAKKRGPYPVGSIRNSTIQSFSNWAKSEVD